MANDREAKIKVTAETGDLKPKMDAGAKAVEDAARRMREAFKGASEESKAHVSKLKEDVVAQASGMAGHFGGLVDVLGKTKIGFALLGAVVAGFAAKAAVDATAEMTEQTMDLARVLGSSTNVAQNWRIALEDVGATQGDLEGASKGMARQLRENEASINAMGVKTRDASGELRPMNDLLVDGLAALNQYKQGADRALAAQQIFGRGVDASSKLLLINQQTLDDNKAVMQDLGLEVGANAVAAWKDFDAASDLAGFGMKGVANTAGSILMPIITDLITAFNTVMPAAIVVVRGALGGLATGFAAVKNGLVVVWETVKLVAVSIADVFLSLNEAIGKALSGDFRGAAASVKSIGDKVGANWAAAMDNIADSSQRTRDRIDAIWSRDSEAGTPEGEAGTKTYKAPPKKEKAEKADKPDPEQSQMPAFQARLAQEKLQAVEIDALREMTKQQELAYWDEILATANLSSKDVVSVLSVTSKLKIDIIRDTAKQQAQLDSVTRDRLEAAALADVDTDQASAQRQVDLGQMTQAQLLELEAGFEDRRFAIKQAALLARQSLIDPDRDPVAYAQVLGQLEALEAQHQASVAQIKGQAAVEDVAKQAQFFQSMKQGFASLTQSLLERTFTWRGAFQTVLQGLRANFAQMSGDMLANWVKTHLLMQAASKTSTLEQVHQNAMKAASGAYAAVAGIPYVGPALAPVAAAAAYAGTMALASAEGGYDIPAGVNPLTQLHEKEMVLPARHAEVIRGLADGGKRSPAGGVLPAAVAAMRSAFASVGNPAPARLAGVAPGAAAGGGVRVGGVMGEAAQAMRSAFGEGRYLVPANQSPMAAFEKRDDVLPVKPASAAATAADGGGESGGVTVNFPGKRIGNHYLMEQDDLVHAIKTLQRNRYI